MTAFIRQEASEKAREIEIKADEEFAIEKSKLVREETDAIDSTYEKKFKQATMSQQITRSTVANKTRLKVLAARQALLDDIFEATRNQVGSGGKQSGADQAKVLRGLVLEGMYAMAEPELSLRARKADFEAVKKAAEEAGKEYKQKSGNECKAKLDEKDPLPEGR